MQPLFFKSSHPAARAIAAIALMAAIGAAVPASAADAPAPAVAAAPMTQPDKNVESRIKDMHTRLGITPAQESDWNNVAQAMRENADTMSTLTQARTGQAKTMTAMDDLKSYAQIAQAHADGIQKFTPVFGVLYASMSDQQKQNADSIFRAHGRKSMKHMTAKAG